MQISYNYPSGSCLPISPCFQKTKKPQAFKVLIIRRSIKIENSPYSLKTGNLNLRFLSFVARGAGAMHQSHNSQLVNTHIYTNLRNHLSSRLISLSVIGLFLELLNDSLPRCSVLEGEFRNDPAELVRFCVLHPMERYSQPQNEFMKSVYDTPMYDPEDDYPFRTIG